MSDKQKLELTWIGKNDPKYDVANIEPRILIENPEKSYGDPNTENMLIHGDNLLALKSLEQQYSGKIKCIYIDPPFNTGNAFENYDDGLEHSIWLNLMKSRFVLLRNLLSDNGVLVVHLDDNEMAYCKVILDEIFGRTNYINTITMSTNDPSGFKATGTKIFSTANYLLTYAKNRDFLEINKIYKRKGYDKAYSKIFTDKGKDYKQWKWVSIGEYVSKQKGFSNPREAKKALGKDEFEQKIEACAIKNADKVFRTAAIGGGAKKKRQETIDVSKKNRNEIFIHTDEDVEDFYILNGEQILFYDKRLEEIDGKLVPAEILTDVWTDIYWTGIAKEGDVVFKNGKKPELLIKRVLELFTKRGDYVLDSFAGSGTTGSVAHKMNRKWIIVELGEQCYTHCLYRMKNIVDGKDMSGITKIVNWQGGGGFKFYELAPSLLRKDSFGNWIIDEKYNANMLGAAMCKHEGFTYNPDEEFYWKQGQSTEKDFIFVTTFFLTVEYLDKIHEEMKSDESLLICCKAYQEACDNKYDNITIKKIPQMVLGKCEFGKDDYNLNIIDLPNYEE
ncbi:site-specific DNA-methyltransferase [Clostridium sporogenes]|uniref:site-specific DNA-methyltransferase n=1 Tax=Clostridium sp. LCP25S3_F8 TaxID=3438751 RepID=UPI0013D17055|nr:site-specific DNA-methyltransferase [Clostridium sporogenes]NFS26526.1 site-specific DNA-methyltransferase [Clostridium sporogenes]